jgi:hypothetical protein
VYIFQGTEGFDPRICETFTAPTNSKRVWGLNICPYLLAVSCTVAVIKYWGKDNVALNTPMNSSASITLDQVTRDICL